MSDFTILFLILSGIVVLFHTGRIVANTIKIKKANEKLKEQESGEEEN